MPLAVECSYQGTVVSVQDAIAIKESRRRGEPAPVFQCIECGERVTPYQSRKGHTPHIEHRQRNPNCSLSNRHRVRRVEHEHYHIEDPRALEGYELDRHVLVYARNAQIAEQRKQLDRYRCQACGFHLNVNGRYVIECHHTRPVAQSGVREVHIEELVSLCPTCHRIAHTRSEPYSVPELKALLSSAA